MHIAATMAALEVWELDRSAKHALVVVCCRANQHTGVAEVSTVRIAADMKVCRNTAAAALDRVVDGAYLIVDRRLGKTPRWRLNLLRLRVTPAQSVSTTAQSDVTRRIEKDKSKDGAADAGLGTTLHLAGTGLVPDWTRERLSQSVLQHPSNGTMNT